MISPVTNWFDGGSLVRIGQKKHANLVKDLGKHESRSFY
jgi:hypothetical protein